MTILLSIFSELYDSLYLLNTIEFKFDESNGLFEAIFKFMPLLLLLIDLSFSIKYEDCSATLFDNKGLLGISLVFILLFDSTFEVLIPRDGFLFSIELLGAVGIYLELLFTDN